MTQATAQPPGQLQKASEEITDSPKSKWKKHLLMLGLATAFVAAGAYQWGILKTLGVLLASECGIIIGKAAWGELKNTYGKKSVAEKQADYDRLYKKSKWAMAFWAAAMTSSVVLFICGDCTGDFVKDVGPRNVVDQAMAGNDKPRFCENVMAWETEDFLPHGRDICIAGSVVRDGNFTLVTPCLEKKDGSCEPLSDKPVIYRGKNLVSNGGLTI